MKRALFEAPAGRGGVAQLPGQRVALFARAAAAACAAGRSSTSGGASAVSAREVARVADEQRAELLRQLEADRRELGARRADRRTPARSASSLTGSLPRSNAREPINMKLRAEPCHSEQSSNAPQKARDDRLGRGRRDVHHRQPVARDAALVEARAHELEVLARVEVDDAGHHRRRRLAGDQVVALRGRLQEVATVLDVHAHARVVERVHVASGVASQRLSASMSREMSTTSIR